MTLFAHEPNRGQTPMEEVHLFMMKAKQAAVLVAWGSAVGCGASHRACPLPPSLLLLYALLLSVLPLLCVPARMPVWLL